MKCDVFSRGVFLVIKFIKSVREDILEKNIYIWNVNTDSMDIFVYLGIMLVDIKGFVLSQDTNAGKNTTVMNRPLITIEEFNEKSNAILITADYCVTIEDAKHLINKPIFKYSDILGTDSNLYRKNVYLYGAGKGAEKLTNELMKDGVDIKGYIISTSPPSEEKFMGKPVKKYDVENFGEKDAIVVSVLHFNITEEILSNCKDAPCDVYIQKCFAIPFECTNQVHMFDNALKENKKILFLNDYFYLGSQIIKFLELYGIEFINQDNYKIDALYDLSFENQNQFIVMINEYDNIKKVELLKKLKLMGFYAADNVVSLHSSITETQKFWFKENDYINDCLCGHSQKYDSSDSCGWKILGGSEENKPKIVILGGSTSTEELYEPETWMRKLYKKLNILNLSFTFYIGGAGDYRAIHELLRFLRDGHIIKPDIVISMSGVNNIWFYPFQNKFNLMEYKPNTEYIDGFKDEDNYYENWLRVENILDLYVKSLKAYFFPFLQPMNLYVPNATVESKMRTETEHCIVGNKEYLENANSNNIYSNLINLFHNRSEMFIDRCHYSDQGAEILSDKVLKVILPTVKKVYASKYS